MRALAFSSLPGGYFRRDSSGVLASNCARNQERASRKRGSRRNSYKRNTKLACSCVSCPMHLSPLGVDSRIRGRAHILQRFAACQLDARHPAPSNALPLETALDSPPELPSGVILAAGNSPELQAKRGAGWAERFHAQHARTVHQQGRPRGVSAKFAGHAFERRERRVCRAVRRNKEIHKNLAPVLAEV